MDDDLLDDLAFSLLEELGLGEDNPDRAELFDVLLEVDALDAELCHDICRACNITQGEKWLERIVFEMNYDNTARIIAAGEITNRIMQFLSGTHGRTLH